MCLYTHAYNSVQADISNVFMHGPTLFVATRYSKTPFDLTGSFGAIFSLLLIEAVQKLTSDSSYF